MKKPITPQSAPTRRSKSRPGKGSDFSSRKPAESVEQAIARVKAMPTLLDELSPETIRSVQQRAGEQPEVLGRARTSRTRTPR
jgi:hypothetical protein